MMDQLLSECYVVEPTVTEEVVITYHSGDELTEDEFFADFYDGESPDEPIDTTSLIVSLKIYKLHGHSVVKVADLPQEVVQRLEGVQMFRLRGEDVVRLAVLESL